MARVTNDQISKIVKGLTSPIAKEIDEANLAMGKVLHNHIWDNTPTDIKNIWTGGDSKSNSRNKSFIRATETANCRVMGRWLSVKLPERIPSNTGDNIIIESPNVQQQLASMLDARDLLTKRKNELGCKIEATLRSLGTDKRILEAFPEAAEFMPAEEKIPNLPANIDLLRNELAQLTIKK